MTPTLPPPTRTVHPHACTFPSVAHGHALLDGQRGAWLPVLGDVASRATLVAAGAVLAGVSPRHAVRAGVAGAVAIEAAVLYDLWRCRRSAPTARNVQVVSWTE